MSTYNIFAKLELTYCFDVEADSEQEAIQKAEDIIALGAIDPYNDETIQLDVDLAKVQRRTKCISTQ